ncbi:MAG: SCP2 sterol-binding domain-containing protein [Thermodesulfobacteriota bacterium]|nr:SCP2 sterol-binding domain-containing protein [Thermodesulfobacteriota bacterium]
MVNQGVLARINLDAVLSNLEIMAAEDAKTSDIAKGWNGSITFITGVSGPRTTLEINNGRIRVYPGKAKGFGLFLPTEEMLNNLFSGEGLAIPIPVKGITKIKGLFVFIKLAKRMEEVLKGDNPPERLKAKLMLNTIAKTMAVIANYEEAGIQASKAMKGTAELRIKDGYTVQVEFTGPRAIARNEAAKEADLIMEFKDDAFFLELADDKVDVFASICMRDLIMEGDLGLGDAVNGFLDKIGTYLA